MNDQEYRTKDIYLASYLSLKGVNLVRLEQMEGKKFMFIFENKDSGIKNMADEFYARKANVEPMEYAITMKSLKSQMYNFQ